MNKLNLGCGKDIREGYINVDSISGRGVDIVKDLDRFPYPFEDNQFDEVLLISVFEHLDNTPEVMKELHRITKPGGEVAIETVHFSSFWSWTDITHKRPYSYFSLDTYNVNSIGECGKGTCLKVEDDVKFRIERKIMVSKLFSRFGLGLFANKFPYIYERFLAYNFPAGNIIFKLYPVKDQKE